MFWRRSNSNVTQRLGLLQFDHDDAMSISSRKGEIGIGDDIIISTGPGKDWKTCVLRTEILRRRISSVNITRWKRSKRIVDFRFVHREK